MERLKNRLKEISAGRILDVGIGRGQFAWIMAESFKSYDEIVGIDTDSEIIKKAERNLSQFKVKLQLMSAEHLEFEESVFDTVSIAQVLHHIPSKEAIFDVLSEMKRVLKPGGTFIVKEMYCDFHEGAGQTAVDYHHFIADIDKILNKSHFKTLNRNTILELTSLVGLQSAEVFEFLFDDEIKHDKKEIIEFQDKIHKRLENIKGHAEYDEMKERAKKIVSDAERFGLAYEKEIVILGKKPI